ncbi:MAG: methyltransferase domain-containing protein [Bacteroidetes bacterium]|nr:methyltransferase domain-containing protein [Bacteroidota bacterium]
MTTTEFADYAHYYDLLYKDKDYLNECFYIRNLINKHGEGESVNILELGCGTGNHAINFSGIGYHVTGVDLSEQMIKEAKKKSEGNSNVEFFVGDTVELDLKKEFDVVLSLFHVMSYQKNHAALRSSLSAAADHLRQKGLLIFDFWYGPGVLKDPPQDRTKQVEDEDVIVTRKATPNLFINQNLVNVHYELSIENKKTGETSFLEETHRVRYLFLPEIEYFLMDVGLELLDILSWMELDKEPDADSWYACVIAKKP